MCAYDATPDTLSNSTYPVVSGTAAAAFVVMAAPGANPRKFAEKIAQHMQKGAEEEAEFRKIMSECAMVKQNPHRVSTPNSVVTPKVYPLRT